MNPRRLRIAAATAAGLLACGLPLWPIPYSDVSFFANPKPGIWLLLGTFAGFIAAWLLNPGWRAPWLSVAGGFVLAVALRILVETFRDPTSHNLWPFEVVIVAGFGLVSGLIGVALGRGVQQLLRPHRAP